MSAGPEYKAQPYWLDSKTAPPEGKEPEGTVHARPVYYNRLRVLNPRGILAMVLYTAALGFYIWIRVTKTLGLAQYTCALLTQPALHLHQRLAAFQSQHLLCCAVADSVSVVL